jgi:hypothetical protein
MEQELWLSVKDQSINVSNGLNLDGASRKLMIHLEFMDLMHGT